MVDRIKTLCKAQGTSVTKLEVALEFGNGTIGKWRNAKNDPPIDKLQKVADALGVSVHYLLTGENENKPTLEGEPMSIDVLRGLSKEELYELMNNVVKALKEKE